MLLAKVWYRFFFLNHLTECMEIWASLCKASLLIPTCLPQRLEGGIIWCDEIGVTKKKHSKRRNNRIKTSSQCWLIIVFYLVIITAKTQRHITSCPHLPNNMRRQLYGIRFRLLHDSNQRWYSVMGQKRENLEPHAQIIEGGGLKKYKLSIV